MSDHDDLENRLRAYVRAAVHDPPIEHVTRVRRLTPGENHDAYVVTCSVPDVAPLEVLVRVATSERARDREKAEAEAAVLRKLHGMAAPLLFDFAYQSEWFDVPTMCMQFIVGAHRAPEHAQEVERLGYAIGRLHDLPTVDLDPRLLPNLPVLEYLDTRLARIDEKMFAIRDPLPEPVQHRLRQARSSLATLLNRARDAGILHAGEPLVLLHGDAADGNILWTPEPILIDWEYARLGDAADEIAYIFNQNDLDAWQRAAFWRGYQQGLGGDLPADLLDRVRWWEPVTTLGSAFFWLMGWARETDRLAEDDALDCAAPEPNRYLDNTLRRLGQAEALLDGLSS